ncbi:MAG TPA: hypothetical protein VKO43_03305 [Candidatus Krumholzibacteriaceae bacterium]|nr:hypothetical protein [Candidatus Krumholzibacteriaceae bacterium]
MRELLEFPEDFIWWVANLSPVDRRRPGRRCKMEKMLLKYEIRID